VTVTETPGNTPPLVSVTVPDIVPLDCVIPIVVIEIAKKQITLKRLITTPSFTVCLHSSSGFCRVSVNRPQAFALLFALSNRRAKGS
jgi:hypothetical protein